MIVVLFYVVSVRSVDKKGEMILIMIVLVEIFENVNVIEL